MARGAPRVLALWVMRKARADSDVTSPPLYNKERDASVVAAPGWGTFGMSVRGRGLSWGRVSGYQRWIGHDVSGVSGSPVLRCLHVSDVAECVETASIAETFTTHFELGSVARVAALQRGSRACRPPQAAEWQCSPIRTRSCRGSGCGASNPHRRRASPAGAIAAEGTRLQSAMPPFYAPEPRVRCAGSRTGRRRRWRERGLRVHQRHAFGRVRMPRSSGPPMDTPVVVLPVKSSGHIREAIRVTVAL
jgi:hypothetical protein